MLEQEVFRWHVCDAYMLEQKVFQRSLIDDSLTCEWGKVFPLHLIPTFFHNTYIFDTFTFQYTYFHCNPSNPKTKAKTTPYLKITLHLKTTPYLKTTLHKTSFTNFGYRDSSVFKNSKFNSQPFNYTCLINTLSQPLYIIPSFIQNSQ